MTDWWKTLQDRRGDRADLRRAAGPAEVAFTPAYVWLLNRARDVGLPATLYATEAIAALAGLAAHVDADDVGARIARSLARSSEGKKTAVLSELRFRRLVAAQRPTELYPHLRRAIVALGRRADLGDLANSLVYWSHPSGTVRKQWALDYFTEIAQPTTSKPPNKGAVA